MLTPGSRSCNYAAVRRERFAAVAVGGMAGAAARWAALNVWPVTGLAFPWPVLTINVIGSVILGTALAEQWGHPRWRLLLHDGVGVGFCGGLTTFSTFAVEVAALGRAGQGRDAFAYAVLSVALAVAGVVAGALALRQTRAITLPVEGDELDDIS